MIKNFLLLGLMILASLTYAKKEDGVIHDSVNEARAYKVEGPVEEIEAQRSVAGARIKKSPAVKPGDEVLKEEASEKDSEVRYWQYSE